MCTQGGEGTPMGLRPDDENHFSQEQYQPRGGGGGGGGKACLWFAWSAT